MTLSEGTGIYREKVEERPIRVDHVLIGERESKGGSVDGVSHEDVAELFKGSERYQKLVASGTINIYNNNNDGMHSQVLTLLAG